MENSWSSNDDDDSSRLVLRYMILPANHAYIRIACMATCFQSHKSFIKHIRDIIHHCFSHFIFITHYCWWEELLPFWYGKYLPLFTQGFMHPRWFSGRISEPSTLVCSPDVPRFHFIPPFSGWISKMWFFWNSPADNKTLTPPWDVLLVLGKWIISPLYK